MHKKEMLTLIAILLLFLNYSFSQTLAPNREIYKPEDLVPKSPDVSNLFRLNDVPVDLSSGTANVNIPIYTIDVGRIQVPISVSYSTSGIKVQDIASPVGLGWTLSPTYMVSIDGETDSDLFSTRNVKTLPQAYSATVNYSTMANNMQLLDVANGVLHQEQTKFNFRCGSITGTFLYDQDGIFKIVSKTKNLKVELKRLYDEPTTAVIGCKITTNEGIEYSFNKAESFINSRKSIWPPISSALYLTEIKDLITGDVVSFVYKDKPVYTDFRSEINTYSEVEDMRPGGTSCPYGDDCWKYNEPGTSILWEKRESNPFEIHGVFLESIGFKNGYVSFESEDDRLDIDETRLTAITVYDSSYPTTRQIKKAVFNNQSYFISDYFDSSIDAKYKHRLKLQDITFYSDYTDSRAIEKYSFDYNEMVKLPGYRINNSTVNRVTNSSAVDFWGYYNGKNGNSSLVPTGLPGLNNTGAITLANSGRVADENFTAACILTKVTYPTGGFTTFEYENHKLSFDCSDASTSTPCTTPGYYLGNILGGLRVKKVKSYSSPSSIEPDIEKNYNYTSGVVLTPASAAMFSYNKIKTYIGKRASTSLGFVWPYKYYEQSGNPLYGITLHNESPIYYNEVEEFWTSNDGNIGKTLYTYEAPEAILYHYSPLPEYGFKRKNFLTYNFGLEKAIEIYKKISDNSYALIRKDIFEYHSETGAIRPGLHVFKNGVASSTDQDFIKSYDGVGLEWQSMYSSPLQGNSLTVSAFFNFYEPFFEYSLKRLKKRQTINYDDIGNQLISSNNYFYENFAHYNITRSEFVNSRGDIRKIEYKYFLDRDQLTGVTSEEANAFDKLALFNKVDDLLQETEYLNNVKVRQDRVRFKLFHNTDLQMSVPFPGIIEKTITQDGIDVVRKKFLLAYDSKGNILSQRTEHDFHTNYLWAYNSRYPVAEIKNATFDEVLDALGYTRLDYHSEASNFVPTTDYLNRINNLRVNMPSAMTTTYSYKPFVGITSKTDPNKVTTSFEYDSFGRLQVVTDGQGNIVKTFDYHYKQ